MPCNFLWYWVGNFGAMDCGDITIHNRRPADVLAGPYLSNSTTGYRPDFAGRQRKEAHDAPVPVRPEFGSAFVVIRDVNTRSMDEEIPTYSNTRGAPTSAAPRDPQPAQPDLAEIRAAPAPDRQSGRDGAAVLRHGIADRSHRARDGQGPAASQTAT